MPEIKRRFSLLPVKALGLVLDVLTDGAAKHGDAGWIDSSDTDYLDAMMRHLEDWRDGNLTSEHGFPNLAHVAARAILLLARSTIKNERQKPGNHVQGKHGKRVHVAGRKR